MKIRASKTVVATATALVLLAGANAASASTPTGMAPVAPARATAPTPAAASTAQASGVRAYVDPKTHKLRPATEEERAAEAQASTFAPAPRFKVDRLANGALRAEDVSGSLMEEVEATRHADGSVGLSYDEDVNAPTSQPAAKLEEK